MRVTRRQRKAAQHRTNRGAKQRKVRAREKAIREARKKKAKPA